MSNIYFTDEYAMLYKSEFQSPINLNIKHLYLTDF